ncbi:MAG: ribonuclease P protein component [Prevotella sp.]
MTTTEKPRMTFGKSEHIVSRKTIEKLFAVGNRSMVAYPIRMVYMPVESADMPVQVLVSVSKRHFKRAVKRNRVKRQIREAYRKHKGNVVMAADDAKKAYALAFIYMADRLFPSKTIDESIVKLLTRLSEKIAYRQQGEKRGKADDGTNGE